MNLEETELILNPDGSVYHLHLKAEHIANTVLLVGDPGRVEMISSKFDTIEHRISNREFTTHTGTFKGERITALSTGIGTDNIDIVVNELDAAVNIDPVSKKPNPNIRSLNLIRLGTCGALQASIEVDSIAVTECSIGLDGVRHFYALENHGFESAIEEAFIKQCKWRAPLNQPYAVMADSELLSVYRELGTAGITITANGFFGPQGRALRLPLSKPEANASFSRFQFRNLKIINYEMESSALYALGRGLGHRCLCMCVVIGNRAAGKFSKDYHPAVDSRIDKTLALSSSL